MKQRSNLTLPTITFLALIVVPILTHVMLRPFSPRAVDNALYSIKFLESTGYVKRYQLQGDRLQCNHEDLVRVCTTIFEGKPLIVETRNTPQMQAAPVECELTYGNVSYRCDGSWDYENRSPSVLVRDDLGISAERFQQLRRENPLLYLQENDWLRIASISSAVFSLIIGVLSLQSFNKAFVADWRPAPLVLPTMLVLGSAFGLSMVWPLVQMRWLILVAALLFGVWAWRLVRAESTSIRQVDRITFAVAIGLTIFGIANFLMLISLLSLGFVD